MTNAAPVAPERRLNPWPFLPFAVILTAMIPSSIMIVLSTQRSTDPVLAAPYAAAQRYDADQTAMRRWNDANLVLQADTIGPQRIRLRLDRQLADGGVVPADLSSVRVEQYRSDTSDFDQAHTWERPNSPLVLELPRGGDWRFRVVAEHASGAVRHQQWVTGVPWAESVTVSP